MKVRARVGVKLPSGRVEKPVKSPIRESGRLNDIYYQDFRESSSLIANRIEMTSAQCLSVNPSATQEKTRKTDSLSFTFNKGTQSYTLSYT